jgi:hypothetical protein
VGRVIGKRLAIAKIWLTDMAQPAEGDYEGVLPDQNLDG